MNPWLIRRKRLMAQLHDTKRQLQEMREERNRWRDEAHDWAISHTNTVSQLHRVARERDEERRLRLEAEERLPSPPMW